MRRPVRHQSTLRLQLSVAGEIIMELKVQASTVILATYLLAQLLPCQASNRIENFVLQTPQNICSAWIGPGKRKVPSESVLESELYYWRLDCKNRISSSAKSLQKLPRKNSAKFLVEIEKKDNSGFLELKQSSGSRPFDRQAEDVIRNACPFKAPFNDLPFKRGLLIEIGPSMVAVQLAHKKQSSIHAQ